MAHASKRAGAGAALITGAGRRIGRTIALALSRAGYAVVLHANRSRADAETLAGEIVGAGGNAAVVLADLVNNAGAFEPDEIETLQREDFERTFAVNLAAPLFLAQAFARQAPAGSSIINVLDQRVFKPTPRFLSYTLSKRALHAATATLAQALAPRLRVNAVAPGPTLPSPRQTDTQFAEQVASLPLRTGPSPRDIAAAVLYLEQAKTVTGVTIAVDGGQHLAWQTPDSDLAE
jgi:NAD(P)-dependent dehydrogenase (short-subunit alcohol dehydrogenase family)